MNIIAAPVRRDSLKSFKNDEVKKRLSSTKFVHLTRVVSDILEAFGVDAVNRGHLVGGWKENGVLSLEVPQLLELGVDYDTALVIAGLIGATAPHVQNTVIAFQRLDWNDPAVNGAELRMPVKSADAGMAVANAWAEANPGSGVGFSFDTVTREFMLLVKEPNEDIRNAAIARFKEFYENARQNGWTRGELRIKAATVDFVGEGSFGGAVQSARDRGREESDPGRKKALLAVAAKAERRLEKYQRGKATAKLARAALEKRRRTPSTLSSILRDMPKRGFENIRGLGNWLDRRFQRRFGVSALKAGDPATLQIMARTLVTDILDLLAEDGSGAGWYDETVKETVMELQRLHPELETDPGALAVFTAILAATSQGYTVQKNFENAEVVYGRYKADGTIPVDMKWAKASDKINENLELVQEQITSVGTDGLMGH